MFILYGVVIGVVLGFALGGSPARLGEVRFHWKPVVFIGLITQVILFDPSVALRVGDLGPWLYVASTAAVLAALLRNWRIPGLPIIAIGAISNFVAIVANGGYMPASPEAMAALGKAPPEGYSNSVLLTDPALWPLTDILALPRWLPFANVYSIGDVLIGIGTVWAIVALMRSGAFAPAASRALPVVNPSSSPGAEVPISHFSGTDADRTVRHEGQRSFRR